MILHSNNFYFPTKPRHDSYWSASFLLSVPKQHSRLPVCYKNKLKLPKMHLTTLLCSLLKYCEKGRECKKTNKKTPQCLSSSILHFTKKCTKRHYDLTYTGMCVTFNLTDTFFSTALFSHTHTENPNNLLLFTCCVNQLCVIYHSVKSDHTIKA